MMRILGIDASLRSTGVAIVEYSGFSMKAIDYRPIKNSAKLPLTSCLKNLVQSIHKYISEFQPNEVAIEGIYYCKNVKTSIILGQARGAMISTCAVAGLPVYEYSPTRIKQAVTGTGTASKEQIQRMMMRILSLSELPQEDAGDALAIAMTHIHGRNNINLCTSNEI